MEREVPIPGNEIAEGILITPPPTTDEVAVLFPGNNRSVSLCAEEVILFIGPEELVDRLANGSLCETAVVESSAITVEEGNDGVFGRDVV